jgi:hypothetical protein
MDVFVLIEAPEITDMAFKNIELGASLVIKVALSV